MRLEELIYVAGHRGLVGSAIVRQLRSQGYKNILTATSSELDLTDRQATEAFFSKHRPDYVFLAAAKVGGIWANKTRKAEFIHQNLLIQTHAIHAAHLFNVKKLLFLGSSCIYPRMAPQPIREDSLLQGQLEETNDAYAIAKISGIMMCRAYHQQYQSQFIACMPTNLYGPHDNFDLESSHVLPALIHRFHLAKVQGLSEVTVWGSGSPRREFLFVDDCAQACIHLMNTWDSQEIVNVGTGTDVSIRELAEMVSAVVGYKGAIVWDSSRPDGTPRKLLDVERLRASGFEARTELRNGLELTYAWFLQHFLGEKV